MSFPQSVKEAAYTRSGGVCECKRSSHPKHSGKRCKTSVTDDVPPSGGEAFLGLT